MVWINFYSYYCTPFAAHHAVYRLNASRTYPTPIKYSSISPIVHKGTRTRYYVDWTTSFAIITVPSSIDRAHALLRVPHRPHLTNPTSLIVLLPPVPRFLAFRFRLGTILLRPLPNGRVLRRPFQLVQHGRRPLCVQRESRRRSQDHRPEGELEGRDAIAVAAAAVTRRFGGGGDRYVVDGARLGRYERSMRAAGALCDCRFVRRITFGWTRCDACGSGVRCGGGGDFWGEGS